MRARPHSGPQRQSEADWTGAARRAKAQLTGPASARTSLHTRDTSECTVVRSGHRAWLCG